MAYWIYVTNFDNWEVTKETNILGASKRHRNALTRMNEGDACLVYVKSERRSERVGPAIVGQYEVASKLFEDNKKIFHAPSLLPAETFSLRIRLKPIRVLESPIKFKPLVPNLTFIKNKERWSLSVRGRAVVEIPERDYRTILASA